MPASSSEAGALNGGMNSLPKCSNAAGEKCIESSHKYELFFSRPSSPDVGMGTAARPSTTRRPSPEIEPQHPRAGPSARAGTSFRTPR
eukprot:CAMPEP_0171677704 /NCGR_PEP_ID=MMETSP0990-20121206/55200_1 /TAXON_ID=483369 /ORGANISM="non described non described, Strain CCMP2098" /LENGTH=87 /DNA_ID=CAMNT_0012264149 /DNA_START=316 /DNA_END=577 /DNA_ORIENTATION=-